MSRIRGIEVKVQKEVLQTRNYGLNEILKKKSEDNSSDSKDNAEKNQISSLLEKLPQLDALFEVHRKIGEGTFSSVYLGSLRRHAGVPREERRWFAIKHLVPTAHPARVTHELRCLQDMGGKHNVIGVDLCLRHLDTIVFVMPYIPHRKFSEYVRDMDADEVRRYMRALLTALRHVHSYGVIHRDIKPSNFLYSREDRRYQLVDFGLAQRLVPAPAPASPAPPPAHQSNSRKRTREEEVEIASAAKRAALESGAALPPTVDVGSVATCACAGLGGVCGVCSARPAGRAPRAGTQGYRPPEVLLKVGAQTTAVDMWACGVILASALCARYPLLRAAGDVPALAEVCELVGSRALRSAARAMGRRVLVSRHSRGLCLRKLAHQLRARPPAPPHSLHRHTHDVEEAARIVPGRTVAGFPDSAFSLATLLLHPDPARRLTAHAALQHPFLTED